MEQNENVHPGTVGATPRPEEMIGAGFAGNADAGQSGGLEAVAESCNCEHEDVTASVEGQHPMDGGSTGVQGVVQEVAMGQTQAQGQYQQPPQVEPQYQAQPQYQPQNQPPLQNNPQQPRYQAPPPIPEPQYQPQQAGPVHSAPSFPPQQPQPGRYSPQYSPGGYPQMAPPQNPHPDPRMNPLVSGQGIGYMGAEAKHVEHDENRFGRMADMVGRFVQGEATTGDMVKGIFSLNFRDDQFWKGALAGAVAALVLNSDMFKEGVGKIFAGGAPKSEPSSGASKAADNKAETAAEKTKSK